MSGEPKTLTPQKCVWKRDPDGDSYVWVIGCTNEFSIQPDAEDYGYCPRCGQDIKLVTAPLEDHEGRWPEAAPSVPVVARDEANELTARLAECYRETGVAYHPDTPDRELAVRAVEEVRQLRLREQEAHGTVSELRAALDAARDAMVSALAYHHHSLSNPVKEELNAAINRAGRALAGGES